MIRTLVILVAACAVAFGVEIPDTLVVDGQTYKGVTYQSHDASRLRIMHETGVAALPIAGLSADLQTKLGYDEKAAQAAEAAVAQQQQQHASVQAQRSRLNQAAKVLDQAAITIQGRVFQVVPGGVLIESDVYSLGTITESQEVSTDNLLHPDETKTVVTQKEGLVSKRLSPGKYVFIETRGAFVDGSDYSGTIYPIGTHSFTTVMGAPTTVAKFTDIPEVAMEVHGLK